MADDLQREYSMLPITALAFLELDLLYLLAGEGEYLEIFHHGSRKVLYRQKPFESQAIHGIACQKYLGEGKEEQALLLIWGGRSLGVLIIENLRPMDGDPQIKVTQKIQALQMDDWILDGCFRGIDSENPNYGKMSSDCLIVTAHNELHVVRLFRDGLTKRVLAHDASCIASGPRSILYSAHISWSLNHCVLVAAGTVFGEVLLWSHEFGDSYVNGITTFCHKLEGHEGSVFGVQISEVQNVDESGENPQRLLASCSDDRTIRIWDISKASTRVEADVAFEEAHQKYETGFSYEANETSPSRCLANGMGHASRIWGLRFLVQDYNSWELVSYGEDGTAQAWRLTHEPKLSGPNEADSTLIWDLEHRYTYFYHSGKNIWALAGYLRLSGEVVIATGGADGQIVTYKPTLHGKIGDNDHNIIQATMTEVVDATRLRTETTDLVPTIRVRTITQELFDGLEGQWNLSRKIESKNSHYPSGTLEGVTTFRSRSPSDAAFSGEYLYTETGNFVTEAGLVMKATRQYVYRHQEDGDSITVWFVKPEDGSTVDYFFHDLSFPTSGNERRQVEIDAPKRLTANGHHLCGEDNYNVIYSCSLLGTKLHEFTVSFTVVGPKKDYVTTAIYHRDIPQNPRSPNTSNKVIAHKPQESIASMVNVGSGSRKKICTLKPDSFKTYAWLSETQFLTSTERGIILVGTLNRMSEREKECTTTWEMISQEPLLKSSCITTSIVSLGICFLTGTDGTVFIYNHNRKNIEPIHSLRGKAGFLKAQRLSNCDNASLAGSAQTVVSVVAASLGCSTATVLLLHADEKPPALSFKEQYNAELHTDFIVTSSCVLDNVKTLVLGSRNGDLAMYSLSEPSFNISENSPSMYIANVYGQDAVTAIEMIPSNPLSSHNSHIITAGRNGSYAIHQIMFDLPGKPIDFETLHIGVPPFGPNIEGICTQEETMFLWGFRSKDFIVWNETQKTETMTVNCGGAHRNWAYHHHQSEKRGGNFVYTKASTCHIHTQKQASHQVMQHGGHGREIKAIALSPSLQTRDGRKDIYLATSAEDTAIRISDATWEGFRCLSIITKHTTGLQALRWSTDGRFLFSAAGCEEFFVWRVRLAPLVTIGVVCEARCPRVTEEGDLRIMDFAVLDMQAATSKSRAEGEDEAGFLITMVYSDSSIRVFRYHTTTKSFTIVSSGVYSTSCLTEITYLHFAEKLWICTASTDGHLAFWPLPLHGLMDPRSSISPLPHPQNPPTYTKRIPIHQNSIKSLTALSLPNNLYLIATAGDDGAVAFTHLTSSLTDPDNPPTHSILLIPKAHAGAVTAIAYLGIMKKGIDERADSIPISVRKYRFVSVGNDQRGKVWIVSVDGNVRGGEGIRVVRGGGFASGVADASCVDVVGGGNEGGEAEGRLFVGGVGVERWSFADGGKRWWEVGKTGAGGGAR